MSQDIINDLPRELLCQVFELLPFKDQIQAMETCTNWDHILSDDRFTAHKRIRLIPYVELGGDLDDLLHYRSFEVTMNGKTAYDPETLPMIAAFLRRDEVAGRVEELRLDEFHRKLPKLLGKSTLHLPKLQKLWLNVKHKEVSNLVVPALKHVELSNLGLNRPAVQRIPFIGQAEKLTLNLICLGGTSIRSCLGDSFEQLRHLEITGYVQFSQSDCEFLQHLGRQLTHLTVHVTKCGSDMAIALQCMIPQAANLQVLDIQGHCINVHYEVLQRLPQLRELRLTGCSYDMILEPNLAHQFAMPNLVKLTAQPGVAALVVAENLRSLTIIGSNAISPCMPQVFKNFPQLSALRLVKVKLNSYCVEQLAAAKVQVLEMHRVFVQRPDLERIMGVLTSRGQLQRARFEDCRFSVDLGNSEKGANLDRDKASYGMLSRQFPSCLVVVKFVNPAEGTRAVQHGIEAIF